MARPGQLSVQPRANKGSILWAEGGCGHQGGCLGRPGCMPRPARALAPGGRGLPSSAPTGKGKFPVLPTPVYLQSGAALAERDSWSPDEDEGRSRTGPWVGGQAENGQRPAGHRGAGTSRAPPPPVDAAAKPAPSPQEAAWSREGLQGTGAPATPSFLDGAEAARWVQLPDPSPPPHRPPQHPPFSDGGQVPGPFLGPSSERPGRI